MRRAVRHSVLAVSSFWTPRNNPKLMFSNTLQNSCATTVTLSSCKVTLLRASTNAGKVQDQLFKTSKIRLPLQPRHERYLYPALALRPHNPLAHSFLGWQHVIHWCGGRSCRSCGLCGPITLPIGFPVYHAVSAQVRHASYVYDIVDAMRCDAPAEDAPKCRLPSIIYH